MRSDNGVLRLACRLIQHGCRRLPEAEREERRAEWTGELPAILYDPDVRFALRRAVNTLLFAVDTYRAILRYRAIAFWTLAIPAMLIAVPMMIFGTLGAGLWGGVCAFALIWATFTGRLHEVNAAVLAIPGFYLAMAFAGMGIYEGLKRLERRMLEPCQKDDAEVIG